MKNEKHPIRVRFPNESYETTVQMSKEDFEPKTEFTDEIFGWFGDIYVAVNKKDWYSMNEKWDISIISETEDGFLVSSPNGDTQWLTKDEMETYKKNKTKQ
jgi:hypothetical protein